MRHWGTNVRLHVESADDYDNRVRFVSRGHWSRGGRRGPSAIDQSRNRGVNLDTVAMRDRAGDGERADVRAGFDRNRTSANVSGTTPPRSDDSSPTSRSGFEGSRAVVLAVVTLAAWLVVPTAAPAYEFDDELSVGGRIFVDGSWFTPGHNSGTDGPRRDNGVEFRRVRLFASGTFDERLAYKLQFDFAGGTAALKDAYLGLLDVPVVGTVKAGHFKEPFSLEELTSSKYILLMERAMVVDALSPSRNTGIAVGRSLLDERLSWRVGAFHTTDGFGTFVGGGSGAVTARVTGLPWRSGSNLLHLGLAYSRRTPPSRTTDDGTTGRFFDAGARPEAHLAPTAAEVPGPGVSAASVDLFGSEVAAILGPTTLTAEYLAARLRPTDADAFRDPPILWGWNVTGSVFATGETRPYDGGDGTLSRPEPSSPFLQGGPGALEFVLRYSQLDLRGAEGGAFANATAGLNWYWSRRARMMLNYGFGHPRFAGGDTNDDRFTQSAQARLQIDF